MSYLISFLIMATLAVQVMALENADSCKRFFFKSTNIYDIDFNHFFENPKNLTEYKDQDGYVKLANSYFSGNMYAAYIHLQRNIKKSKFKQLNWQRFEGSVQTWNKIPEWLYENNEIIAKYENLQGYILFSKQYFDGDMELTFRNVSAKFGLPVIKDLRWKKFQGDVSEVDVIKNIFSTTQKINEFKDQRGYVLYATMHFNKDMEKAFKNTSVALDPQIFLNLGWKKFHGRVSQFNALRKIILNEGVVRNIYVDLTGYIYCADKMFHGDLDKTFKNISSVLGRKEFSWLHWKKLYGTTEQLHALMNDFSINYPKHYIGLKNQKRIATKIYNGNTYITYRNISILRDALFSKENSDLFYKLNWVKK